MKALTFILPLIILIAESSSAHYGPGDSGMGGMMGHWMGWGYGNMFVMLFFWLLFIIAVVLIIRWTITAAQKGHGTAAGETALDILKRRYAKGELSKEEFERTRKDISD